MLGASNVDKYSKANETPVRFCNYVDIVQNERIHSTLKVMAATASADELNRVRIRLGDVLIAKDAEAWNDIGVPALVECEAPDPICGYHLAMLRPRAGVLIGGCLHRVLQCQPITA